MCTSGNVRTPELNDMVHQAISRDKIRSPGRRIGQRWRATRAPTPVAVPRGRADSLCLSFVCPSGGPEGEKLWGFGGKAPKTTEVHSALNSAGVLYSRLL